MKLFNRKKQKELRQTLRNDAPRAEQILWLFLKGSRLDGHKFRRQQGIGPYVVDFYCPARKLVIELDGDSHFTREAQAYDSERTAFFTSQGITTIRFTNLDVYKNIDGVLETIQAAFSS